MTDPTESGGPEQPKRRRRRRSVGSAGAATPRTRKSKSPKRKSTAAKAKAPSEEPTPARSPVRREVSAGGVVYRRDGQSIEVVLASRRTRRGDLAWGLAKGGIEEGESLEDAAIREVREETGIEAVVEASLGDTRYFYVWEEIRIRKTVHFFLMRATGGDPAERDDEMEEIRWFPIERALKRAAYRGEREVLGRALELLR
ncbi:MAG: NUDIX hydrolase [Actinomycetota bacterium]|nr:NUDIX hydrolase [Actinomycetota bacterium]